ncbi:MAG: hypothetical protein A3B70_06495 [Deltaproteobacteria bacterium RIFCSPHIGHO2_02_FULL_40_11]|nr:MAG: hypothetical protein A3B70_06495 [Deltaproteobacteria bacterium RIFCSPHIGHO2_02_FULL_40_11]
MKKWIVILSLLVLPFVNSAYATVTAEGHAQGKATVQETQSKTNGVHANGTAGATVTKSPNEIRITGISSAVAVVDSKKVTGDASGTLVIRWGRSGSSGSNGSNGGAFGNGSSLNNGSASNNNGRGSQQSIFRQARVPMTPPGAPELSANFMFGAGLFIFGFGLILTRKLW